MMIENTKISPSNVTMLVNCRKKKKKKKKNFFAEQARNILKLAEYVILTLSKKRITILFI